jgi:flagellar protein FliL
MHAMATAKEPAKKVEEPKKKGSSMIMMIVVLLVGLGAGGGGAWFMASKAAKATTAHASADAEEGADGEAGEGGDGEHSAASKKNTLYIALDPALVVNLEDADTVRYLQVEMQLQTKKPAVEEAVKLHMPALRNALLMLLSEQDYHELLKVTGKEKLRVASLAAVRRVLKEQADMGGVDNLYFTSFVSQ